MAWNKVGVQFPMWYRVQVKVLSSEREKTLEVDGDIFSASGTPIFFRCFRSRSIVSESMFGGNPCSDLRLKGYISCPMSL